MKYAVLRAVVVAIALVSAACASSEGEPGGENAVENAEGALVITSPARAAFLTAPERVVVRGTGATKALRVNGVPATVAADGTFEAPFEPLKGLNLIVAVDGDRRAESPFLWGPTHLRRSRSRARSRSTSDRRVSTRPRPPRASLLSRRVR